MIKTDADETLEDLTLSNNRAAIAGFDSRPASLEPGVQSDDSIRPKLRLRLVGIVLNASSLCGTQAKFLDKDGGFGWKFPENLNQFAYRQCAPPSSAQRSISSQAGYINQSNSAGLPKSSQPHSSHTIILSEASDGVPTVKRMCHL